MTFRFLTPTDVDRFIQIPETLQVDARSIVLTVEEDTLQKYDHYFKITDYVIYCELEKNTFFNSTNMDWKYKIVKRIDSSGNQFLGPHVEDGHSSANEIAQDVINVTATQTQLGNTTTSTRFVHYKACNQFFKYSFKVGDPQNITVRDSSGVTVAGSTRSAQLFAVYLDSTTGVARPYYDTSVPTDQTAENRTYYYMDSYTPSGVGATAVTVATLLSTINNGTTMTIQLRSDVGGTVSDVTDNIGVICPPDPEFLEDNAAVLGGNLIVKKNASNELVIRQVGQADASNNYTAYTTANFQSYTQPGNRELLLYWVVNPATSTPFMGEEMYVAWYSKISTTIRPVRDLVDASGVKYTDQYGRSSHINEVDRFTFSRTVAEKSMYNVHKSLGPKTPDQDAAPRMYLPVSKFIVRHEQPNENDVQDMAEFDVPFAYEFANNTKFDDAKKSIIGGRVMQMVSQYLFDDSTTKEMAYFPFLLNESKALTDRIILALASKIKETAASVGASRTEILKQILIKYGRRYFEEHATLNQQDDETQFSAYGSVWEVINKINEMFLFFTVAVRTTVSNRTKDDVEIIRLVDVPVVIRVHDP